MLTPTKPVKSCECSSPCGDCCGCTKESIGLGNVDNTSDLNKPLSTAMINALSGKVDLDTFTQLKNRVLALENSMPDITDLEHRMDEAEDDILGLNAGYNSLHNTVLSMADSITELGGRVTGVSDGLVTVGTRVDALETADGNNVKLNIDQTIASYKTFIRAITIQNATDSPMLNMLRTNLWIDSEVSGSRRGTIIGFSDRLGNNFIKLTPWKTLANSHLSIYASRDSYTDVWIGEAGVRVDGKGYAQVVTPDSGATDSSIVNANWVSQSGDSSPNNLIHKNGNETKTGNMTFEGALTHNREWPNLDNKLKNFDITTNTVEQADRGNINWFDKNGVSLGQLRFNILANGRTMLQMKVRNSDGTYKYVTLAIGDTI